MSKLGVNEVAQYFEGIFTVDHDGIVIVDHEGIILRVNPAFIKIFGYEEHEILGKSFDVLAYKNQKMQKITSHNSLHRFYCSENTNMEMTLFDKQGHDISVRFRSVLIRDKHDQIKQAIGMLEHIVGLQGTGGGESSLAEKMWEAQQNFDNVLNNSADVIIMCDISGNIMMANKAFSRMLGYKQEDVRGKHIAEFAAFVEGTYVTTTGEEIIIGEEYVTETASKSAELFERGYVSNWESYLVRKDNVHIPTEITMSVLKDKEGKRRGSVVIVRDITERKRAEREIKKSRDFLEKIIEDIADGIIICDLGGTIINTNSALEKMTGLRKEELIGEHSSILIKKDKEIRKRFLEKAEELFKTGHTSYETVIENRDGKYVEVDCNCSLLKDEKGEYIAGVSVLRDTTERKEMEHKLLQSEKRKSLGELSEGVAHNFNNILAAILGRAQLLQLKIDSLGVEEKKKSILELKKGLKVIEKASQDGAEVVRKIHKFTRKRSGDEHFSPVDINKTIDNAIELTRLKWSDESEEKGIRIDIQKDLSPLPSIAGNQLELNEAFVNLINNAIDAMPQGGDIKIRTYKQVNHIIATIEDTGTGISSKVKNNIFDPFFTTKGPQTRGLGLSVSCGTIKRHKGTVTVNSIEGQGASFTVRFSITENAVKRKKIKTAPEEQKKAKILIIEDEVEVCELLKDILIDKGHEVETASNGNQGIEMFKGNEFNLVFTDLGMPEMSGWQVAEEIKMMNSKTPVSLITGWDVQLKDYELKEKGVDFVVNKPFRIDQVIGLVQKGMELRDRLIAA